MRMTSAEDLRSVYRNPAGAALDKAIQHLDQHCIDYLAKSPFFVLSSANVDGTCDGSPKGGHPGLPNAACMLKDHAAIDVDASVIEDALDRDAEATLWEPGGRG